MADMDKHFEEAERQFESQYKLLDNSPLGEGTYGKVYKARSHRTGECVAMERVELDWREEGVPVIALREPTLQQQLLHPNILPVLDVFCKPSRLTIVLEYFEMDLQKYMKSLRNHLAPPVVRHLTLQIVRGVECCHDHKVLHRDIKPQNLFVDPQSLRLKLGDFGLSREYEFPHRPYTQEVVTVWYRAPELLMGSQQYGCPVDMWSAGCVMAEMATGMPLFPGDSEISTMFKVFEKLGTPADEEQGVCHLPNFSFKFPRWRPKGWHKIRNTHSQVGESGIDLLQRLLVYDAKLRLSAKATLKHEYLADALAAGVVADVALRRRGVEASPALGALDGVVVRQGATLKQEHLADAMAAGVAADAKEPTRAGSAEQRAAEEFLVETTPRAVQSRSVKRARKLKCPYCEERVTSSVMARHIRRFHKRRKIRPVGRPPVARKTRRAR